jgi:hypothetical protein
VFGDIRNETFKKLKNKELMKVRIQESGVRMLEKSVNYQIEIFGVSLTNLTADG